MNTLFRAAQRSDVKEIDIDIDSYLILSRSLTAFNITEIFPLFLNDENPTFCKNIKATKALASVPLVRLPSTFAFGQCLEFKLGGYGQDQIYVLIVFSSDIRDISSFSHVSSTEDNEDILDDNVNDQNEKPSLTWIKNMKPFIIKKIVLPALKELRKLGAKSSFHASIPTELSSKGHFNIFPYLVMKLINGSQRSLKIKPLLTNFNCYSTNQVMDWLEILLALEIQSKNKSTNTNVTKFFLFKSTAD